MEQELKYSKIYGLKCTAKTLAFTLILNSITVLLFAVQTPRTVFIHAFEARNALVPLEILKEVKTSLRIFFSKSQEFTVVCESLKCEYRVRGYVWIDTPYVYADAEVMDSINKRSPLNVGASVVRLPNMKPSDIADSLVETLYEKIVIGITKPVRIAISRFSMAGGNASYESLKAALPAMLETGLSVSHDIVLLEDRSDTLFDKIIQGYSASYKYNPITRLKYGKILLPNYLIRGTFWEHNGMVRIDVKCLNIESGELISGQGITTPVSSVASKMALFASEIRAGILEDLNRVEARKTLAVIGLTPVPNTTDNVRQTKEIVREITRNLKTVDSIRVREDNALIDSFMKYPTDKWEMASALRVNRLVLVGYENHGDGRIVIGAEIFDSEKPESAKYIQPDTMSYQEIDSLTKIVLDAVLQGLSVIKKSYYKHITIKKELRRRSVGLRYGGVITDVDGPLENSTNQSFDFHFSMPSPILNPDNFRLGGLFTWNWGNGTWENVFLGTRETSVHLLSAFLTFMYHRRPGERTDPYCGIGLGYLQLRRIKYKDDNLLDTPSIPYFGMTAIGGLQFFANSAWHGTFQSKFWFGIGEVPADTVNQVIFKDGCLFGLDISVGIGVKW